MELNLYQIIGELQVKNFALEAQLREAHRLLAEAKAEKEGIPPLEIEK
jgi:hypothetical protein